MVTIVNVKLLLQRNNKGAELRYSLGISKNGEFKLIFTQINQDTDELL